MYLALLRKFWWVIPLVAVVIALGWLRFEVDDLRRGLAARDETIATLRSTIDADRRLALALQERATQIEALWGDAVKETDHASNERLVEIDADRASLARRLRDAEERTSACHAGNVPAPAGRSGGGAGPAGEPGSSGDPAPGDGLAAAVDGYDRACRRDAARLAFWIETWQRLKAAEAEAK